ncbi:MAG: AAA family ATPase [Methanomicrobiales archaeon]|nr:AAA family ATPase [Methanomicrobiales archaeon]
MNIDLSGVLYTQLKEYEKKYNDALAKNDLENVKKFALLCANTENQMAEKVPDQSKSHLEKAKKWNEIVRTAGSAPRKRVVETSGKGGGTDDDLSTFGDTLIQVSTVTWKDIGGLSEVKSLIMETVVIAGLSRPDSIKPDKGILLFGPPGTGKTLLAAAAAGSLKATFYNVKISSIISKYVGESSKLVTSLYESARNHAPSIVFIDELDSITMSRDDDQSEASRKVLASLLTELDGFQDKKSDKLILTLSATNTPGSLDDAVLSRFPKRIYIPLPDRKACMEIIRIQTKGLDISAVDLDQIGELCVNQRYSGRDLQNVCRDAMKSMTRRVNKDIFDNIENMAALSFEELQKKTLKSGPLAMDDFTRAIGRVKSPLMPEDLKKQEDWNKQFGAS